MLICDGHARDHCIAALYRPALAVVYRGRNGSLGDAWAGERKMSALWRARAAQALAERVAQALFMADLTESSPDP